MKVLVPVPLRIHSVQSKGLDSENIGVNGAFRPGGIDFTGSHIFDVILIAHPVVRGGGVRGSTIMDDDVFRNHNTA